jgi:hypothetical protein
MKALHTQLYVFRVGHKAVEAWDVSLANHQNMLRSCRVDVPEGHQILVLHGPKKHKRPTFKHTLCSNHACITQATIRKSRKALQVQLSPFNIKIKNSLSTSNRISLLSSRLAILQKMHFSCVPDRAIFIEPRHTSILENEYESPQPAVLEIQEPCCWQLYPHFLHFVVY